MRKLYTSLLFIGLASCAFADTFTNGNFESGTLTGWTQGGGFWNNPPVSNITTTGYLPGGANYNATYITNTAVTPGLDSNTDNNLNRVFSGNYSARVNDANQNYSVSVLSQTVSNYTDPVIAFAWAAVLQDSHGPTDSDNFILSLTNVSKGLTLYNAVFNSADASTAGLFTQSSTGWYYTAWQTQSLDVSAYSGDTFTLSLLASDCPYGAHAGYVYLDGFGGTVPIPGDPTIPEPGSLGFIAVAGLGGAVALWRKRRAA